MSIGPFRQSYHEFGMRLWSPCIWIGLHCMSSSSHPFLQWPSSESRKSVVHSCLFPVSAPALLWRLHRHPDDVKGRRGQWPILLATLCSQHQRQIHYVHQTGRVGTYRKQGAPATSFPSNFVHLFLGHSSSGCSSPRLLLKWKGAHITCCNATWADLIALSVYVVLCVPDRANSGI